MVSISKIRENAEKEKAAEDQARLTEFNQKLVFNRERLKAVRPLLIAYVERNITHAIKRNSNIAGLYSQDVAKIFSKIGGINSDSLESYEILYYLQSLERPVLTAWDAALKEMADNVRQELFEAGVKEILPGKGRMGDPTIRILF